MPNSNGINRGSSGRGGAGTGIGAFGYKRQTAAYNRKPAAHVLRPALFRLYHNIFYIELKKRDLDPNTAPLPMQSPVLPYLKLLPPHTKDP